MKHEQHDTLWELTRGQRMRYALAIVAMGVAIAATFTVPLLVSWAIDGTMDPGALVLPGWLERAGATLGWARTTTLLAAAATGGLVFTAVGGALQYLRGRWAASASEAIVQRLRRRLYEHLDRLPCAYHDRADTGDLVQRCTSDVETVRVFLSAQVVEIGRAILLLLIAIPVLFTLSPGMTLISFLLFPPIVGFALYYFREIKRLFLASDEAEGRMTTVLQENLTGIRVVRAFARQAHERERFGVRNDEFRDSTRRLIDALGSYWALSDLLCLGQIGLVLLVGATWTAEGRLTIGQLNAFLMVEAMVIWPARQLGRILNETGKAIVALGRMREILSEPEEPALRGGLAPRRGEVVFERVGFAYRDGEPVLNDVSFRVSPGEVLALVGPPGAGKSTAAHLLLRLYDHQHGTIRLDGADLRELDPRAVRSGIGAVLQDSFLYSKTVRQNLLVGRASASEEELVHASTTACVHEAVLAFEDGYDTLIGERGVTLSGGQRQRMALARALLKDPAVLVLDDSLSAVDVDTESEILAALDARRGRRTTILITHRLSAAARADRICVLEGGRVVQSGAHADLVDTDGPYRRLWRVQHELEDELETDLALAHAKETGPRQLEETR